MIVQIMRTLYFANIVQEVGVRKYKPRPVVTILVTGETQGDAIKHLYVNVFC